MNLWSNPLCKHTHVQRKQCEWEISISGNGLPNKNMAQVLALPTRRPLVAEQCVADMLHARRIEMIETILVFLFRC